MKTKLIIILIALVGSLQSFAQAPDWIWVKGFGSSSGNEGSHAVVTDAYGNFYLGGGFGTTITFGSTTLTSFGYTDIFIAKFDADSNLIWAKNAGGIGDEEAISVAVDANGSVYITGYFSSPHITLDSITLTNSDTTGTPSLDLFLAKYDINGNAVWAISAGGNFYYEWGHSVATDDSGNVIVSGTFESPSINFGAINLINTNSSYRDVYIAKYNSTGNVIWAKSGGGFGNEGDCHTVVDKAYNIYVASYFSSTSVTFEGNTLNNNGSSDIFLLKYDGNGNLIWAKSFGGTMYDYASFISTDFSNNLIVTGGFSSPTLEIGPYTLVSQGYYDILLLKFDSSGSVIWANSVGGADYESGFATVANSNNSIFLTGTFRDSILTIGATTLINPASPLDDFFIGKYDSLGTILWIKGVSGDMNDLAHSLAIDPDNNLYVTGSFSGSYISFDSISIINSGINSDIFVAKLNESGCNAIANFSLYPDSLLPHHYWAIAMVNGAGPLTYLWSWGDGSYDSIAYPSHIYADSGFYTICLTIEDSTGCVDSFCIDYNILKLSAENTILEVNVVDSIPSIPTAIENTNVLQSWSVFPNPASGNSFIHYTLSTPATVSIALYDVLGNKLQQLVNGNQEQGEHNATIDARKLANGVYVLQIRVGEQVAEEKIIMLR